MECPPIFPALCNFRVVQLIRPLGGGCAFPTFLLHATRDGYTICDPSFFAGPAFFIFGLPSWEWKVIIDMYLKGCLMILPLRGGD